ncbi:MAG: hypothetical protein NC548_29050 [Lachnospiraceae bacterium]|nr:hypothetical protein [Lachnospiraceae bacterium]
MLEAMVKEKVTIEQISASSDIAEESLFKIIKGEIVSSTDSLSILSVYRYYTKNGNIDMLSKLLHYTNMHHSKNEYVNRELQQHVIFVENLKTELRDSLYCRADSFILHEFKLKGAFAVFRELFNKNKWQENVKSKLEYYFSFEDFVASIYSRLSVYYSELNQQRISNIGVASKEILDITFDKVNINASADKMYANFIYTILKSVDEAISLIFYPIEWLLNLLPNFILIIIAVASVIWICAKKDIWGFLLLGLSVIIMIVPDPNEKIRKNLYMQIDEQIELLNNNINHYLITNTNKYYEKLPE